MTTKNLKVLLLLAVMVLTIAVISTTTYAQITPGEDDVTISIPAYTGENPAVDEEDLDAKIDTIGLAIVQLQIQNDRLVRYSVNEDIQAKIVDNNESMDELFAKLDILVPPTPVVEVPDSQRAQMISAIDDLIESGLPVYSLNINSSTGNLDIMIESPINIDNKIRSITGDSMPLDITYGTNTFRLQTSSCSSVTGFCDPLIGGADAEDGYFGLPCTISLAAVRNTWLGTEDGIVIPDHCNPKNTSYYQADNNNSMHLVGSVTKNGGAGCDCSFVKSNNRDIDTGKITIGPDDYTFAGKTDSVKNSWIFMRGTTSGFDSGKIIDTGVSWQDDTTKKWYKNLYKISHINFTDGDSGAPVIDISGRTYAGMNIGAEGKYNYAHKWSYLKSTLNLQ